MKSSKRIFYSRLIFITGIVLLSTLSILFIYETIQENTSSDIVYNTRATRLALEKIYSQLKTREVSILKTALTKDHNYWRNAVARDSIHNYLHGLDSLADDETPEFETAKEKLKVNLSRVMSQQEKIILQLEDPAHVSSGPFKNDFQELTQQTDSIRNAITHMQAIAANLAQRQSMNVQKHTIIATMMGVTVSIFSMIVFILAFYFIDQELKRSQNYLDETQTLNSKVAEINTELEEANRNLHELNSELEGKNYQLEKYAAELSTFTHITSHDMQEPLRKIEFYISIVEDRERGNLSVEGLKYLEKIKQSVSRMRQLFISMLDFSLTNTVNNNVERVDLNEVLDQTLQSLKVYIKDTNAMVESESLPKVTGIKYQLVQLFENIISNAIKFRKPEVTPQINITYSLVEGDHQPIKGLKKKTVYARIDFKDNGIGFDEQYAEKVFEIFQRLLTKTDSYGVGIGLAISRKIAENHGGTLVAHSTPNEGSVFSFYIPVKN